MANELVPPKPEAGIREILTLYQKKLEKGVLPPDPARIAEEILNIPVEVEHAAPVPPLLEYVHSKFTVKLLESLPRLPMTSDFPKRKWLEWIKESW